MEKVKNMITKKDYGKAAKETRLIKSTSKRQITIPKSFYDRLSLQEGEVFTAHLFNEGILLIPSEETVRDQDRKSIIARVLQENYSGGELIEELNFRLKQYDDVIESKIAQFEKDIEDRDIASEDDEVNFNGLDVFFDVETGSAD